MEGGLEESGSMPDIISTFMHLSIFIDLSISLSIFEKKWEVVLKNAAQCQTSAFIIYILILMYLYFIFLFE